MTNSIKNKVLFHIYAYGRGYVFTPNDFMPKFRRFEIDNSLRALVADEKIRKVFRGVYDYPLYSKVLKRNAPPDLQQVALAIARKFSWRIQPTGNAALNYLGLSTQVVGHVVYLSDGPSKEYKVGKQILTFKHTSLKESSLSEGISRKVSNSALLIQAFKSIGTENITESFLESVKSRFSFEEWLVIKKHSSKAPGWIYKHINTIIENLEINNAAVYK